MNSVTYCTGWSRLRKAPAEALAPEVARRLHEDRKPYTAVVENRDGIAVVEMCFYQIYCHVLFLDEHKRVHTRYSFVENADERLFLEEAVLHYYADQADRPSHGEVFRFGEDGSLTHDTGKAGGPITRKEGRTEIRRNYAALPVFGNYESILVRER